MVRGPRETPGFGARGGARARTDAMGSRRRSVAAWGLLLLGATALAADDLTGRLQLSWRDFERGSQASDGLFRFYEVNFDRLLTEAFRLRLGVRGLDDASGSTLTGERRTSDHGELEPRLRLTYRRPTVDFETFWSSLASTSVETPAGGEQIERRQTFERLRASLAYRPADLPSLVLDGYRRKVRRSESGESVTESAGQGRLDYSWGGLHLSALAGSTRVEDTGVGFERTSDDLQGQIDFSRGFWDDRVVVGATANRFTSDIDRRALGAGDATVPDPVAILVAFQTYDETPGDHLDRPLVANPLLRDGDLERPAGLPFGPADPSDLDLAVDFGRTAEVDEVRIVARDRLGNPVTSGGPVVWDVYTSVDGIRWVPVLDGVETRFDTALSLWSVRFPPRATRWLQLVSFFVNSVETELTEVQAFANDVIPGGAPRHEEFVLESGRGHLAFRVTERVSMRWQGLWTRSRTTEELGENAEISNADHLLFLNWDLPASLSVELRGERREQDLIGGEELGSRDYRGLTGILRWQPGADLDTGLEITRGREQIDGVGLDLERIFAHAFLRPWRGLEISLEGGRQRQDFAAGLASIETPSASGYVKTWIRPSLIVTFQASTSRATVRGELPPELLVAAENNRWSTDVQWTPSGRLNVGARFGRAEGGGNSTPIQSYRLVWSPFAGGAVSVTARYDEFVDPARDRRSRRLIVTPQWALNPRLRLNLDIQQLDSTSAGVTTDSRSAAVTLSTDF